MSNSKNRQKIRFIVHASLIAAFYTVVSLVFAPTSVGPVQLRISEALCVLPYFTSAAIPGLFIGCVIANSFVSGMIWADIVFGSLATLAAALAAYALRRFKWLVPLPAVIFNAFAVPFVLKYGYGFDDALWFMMITVGLGQIGACYCFGMPLMFAIDMSGIFSRTDKEVKKISKK
ncbi:MAG: QueT transporter family protein [Ruminococcaceae bacterium]|nr:QueT transporter family protein [Oscillospiraceae bacterium]